MPPLTPSATSAIRLLGRGLFDFLYRARHDFLQRATRELRGAVGLRQAAAQQLTRSRRGNGHHFERISFLRLDNRWIRHCTPHASNVFAMAFTVSARRARRARSAVTIAAISSTHRSTSSLTTT